MQMGYKYTNQEAFDLVATRLIKQGEPSYTYGIKPGHIIGCHYFLDGNRCAAGWLIPDGHAALKQEQAGNWDKLIQEYPELASIAEAGFVCELQDAHDLQFREGAQHWKEAMIMLAVKHGVDPKIFTY